MKIILVAYYYPEYLKYFEQNNQCEGLNYHEHQEKLFGDYYGAFISYRNHFRGLGYECELLVDNYYSLQQKWLDERNIRIKASPETKHHVIMHQLEEFGPDVFFIGGTFDYYGPFLQQVKQRITENIFVWIACPFPKGLDFRSVRCALTSVPNYLNGIDAPVEVLPAAFDANIVERIGQVKKEVDVSFVGSLSSSHGYRRKSLKSLLSHGMDLQVWGHLSPHGLSRLRRDPLKKLVSPPVWGMHMYRSLARSRITLNFHIDAAKHSNLVGNMRMFEATGCGAMLLTDSSDGLGELFRPGEEVEAFESLGELQEKVKYYLEHEKERSRIAVAGQRACIDRCGYNRRILEVEKILEKYVTFPSASVE